MSLLDQTTRERMSILFIRNFTIPLTLASLDSSSTHCSICAERFGEYDPNSPDPVADHTRPEWAVRIDMDIYGSGRCHHVFGVRCLHLHLRSPGAWHNKCPMCRDTWFAVFANPVAYMLPMGSVQTEMRTRMEDNDASTRESDTGGRLSSRGRLHRSIGFIQQMLREFDIDDRDAEMRFRVAEAEMALERAWRRLEEAREENGEDA
ncbi:hypothetical protein K469DRAFT_694485 [Zopfia rhizophila CBS 207.26]|uniref:RING-type domain-containing protein n=1 Tax=Zopfia rhizophila CBS 207.26 TaxID=1314779 RepID=A0A6A6ER26_9PEZI|nr:hypothetical protein K469DRAFT_694485 [Zopfia rhizophila CBS 207.26]